MPRDGGFRAADVIGDRAIVGALESMASASRTNPSLPASEVEAVIEAIGRENIYGEILLD